MSVHTTATRIVRRLVSPNGARWGVVAMIFGLVATSFGSVASAQPVAQATPTSSAACVRPPQGIVISMSTPNPGDVLSTGANVVVSGIAYDTAASSDPGIDRVSVYFGDRDAGGQFWGNALLGQPNASAGSGPLANAGFTLRSPTLPSGSGSRDIFVYAHSAISNKDAAASVPVYLGAAPTPVRGQVPTPVLPPPPACTPVPTLAPTSTAVPPAALAPTTLPAPAAATPASLPPIVPPALPAAPTAAPAVIAQPAPATAPAVAPSTATTAPRGGGIPAGLGLAALGLGSLIVGGGFIARRRERQERAARRD